MSKIWKKLLAVALTASISAGAAVAGTVAYLQDEDSDVNVMTLGNVYIDQIEQEWDATETALQPFTQAKPLYPAVGTLGWENNTVDGGAYRRFSMENAVDKYVSVKNTGKSDAYVRTIIALEMGSLTVTELAEAISLSVNKKDGDEFDFPGAWVWPVDDVFEIDGKNYNIMVAVHEDAVEPGDTTIPSLLQVYMKSEADNDTVAKIDGNDNGTYDILVLSQAVQTAGFESVGAATALNTAFGEANAANVATWFAGEEFKPVTVDTAAELQTALDNAKNGTTIILTDDIEGDLTATQKANVAVTIDGGGKEFDGVIIVDGKSATYTTAGLTIQNVNFKADSLPAGVDACINLGEEGNNNTRYTCNVTVKNCTFDVPGAVGVKSYTGGDKNLTIERLHCYRKRSFSGSGQGH